MTIRKSAYREQRSPNLQAPVLEKNGQTGLSGWVSVEMFTEAGNSPPWKEKWSGHETWGTQNMFADEMGLLGCDAVFPSV